MYNYLLSSWGITLIFISDCISECKLKTTTNDPNVLISFVGCIIDGFISIFSLSFIIFEISVGFTDPYNSLFSVLNFLISYSLFLSLSASSLAIFFLSWSFLFKSDLIFSTSLIFSLEANKAFFFGY